MLQTKLYARNSIGTGVHIQFSGDCSQQEWCRAIYRATTQTNRLRALKSALNHYRNRSNLLENDQPIIAGLRNLIDYVGTKNSKDKRKWRTQIVAIDCTVGHDLL